MQEHPPIFIGGENIPPNSPATPIHRIRYIRNKIRCNKEGGGIMQPDTQPLISVIVPIYKVEQYLDKCVESIVNQTYNNLEILLIDDGSPDACPAICDAWAKKDRRIKAFHKANGGLADARNYGLDRANGEWIYCVDSDDWIEPDLIKRTYTTAHATGADIVSFAYSWADGDTGILRVSQDSLRFPREGLRTSDDALTLLWSNQVQNYAWSFFVKKSVYHDVRFPTGMIMEDVGTTYRLFANANSVYFLPQNLYNYRIRNNSILSKMNPEICKATVHFIHQVDDFAQNNRPNLQNIELDWSIRYLSSAILWAYQCQSSWNDSEYRAFIKETRRLLVRRCKQLGITHMAKSNLVKSTMIRMHMVGPLDFIASHINQSTSR